jgi:hypothetical protein
MANLLMLQDQLGDDFRKKGKMPRKASKAALAGKLGGESPSKEMAQMPPKYQLKEDDDKQVKKKWKQFRGNFNFRLPRWRTLGLYKSFT